AQTPVSTAVDGVEIGVVKVPAQVGGQVQAAAHLEAANACLVEIVVVAHLAAALAAVGNAYGLDQAAHVVLEYPGVQRPAVCLIVRADLVSGVGFGLEVGVAVDGEHAAATDGRVAR